MEKATFLLEDNRITIGVPFQKSSIDLENRTVSGWATIDNEDSAGEVVTAEASEEAFRVFRGNVREQHNQLKAVGKVVQYDQKEYFDAETGELHRGIFVKVYVSKGAENTWQKVLDGTLSGFSIGGLVPDSAVVKHYIPEEDRYRKFITKYLMTELSLVDSPCNTLCNVVSINKGADGIVQVEGFAMDTTIENVFWCNTDRKAVLSDREKEECLVCRKSMINVGWFEPESEQSDILKIKKILHSHIDEQQTKGGSEMSEEKEVVDTAEKEVDAVEENTEIASEVANAEEPDLANVLKALDSIKTALEKVTQDGENRETALEKIRETIDGVEQGVESKLADLLSKHTELSEEISKIKGGLGNMEKRLDTVVQATAMQKSSDVETTELEVIQKNKVTGWSGVFLPPSFDQ
jgi:hypothetical protein